MSQIAEVGFDREDYVGNGRDGVYFSVAEGPDGWYVSAVADCGTDGELEPLATDDGPHETHFEAEANGIDLGLVWCACQGIEV
jgi:hypothetical protein